jgi:pyruvate/2-oxoglutarate dehydrogenase complex dihydrolipoamide dehydrogenase (E3) component
MPDETWPRVVVLGAGAVGCYFGGMLARAGAPVTMNSFSTVSPTSNSENPAFFAVALRQTDHT